MKTNYKRSLWGYDPAGVNNLVNKMDRDYKDTIIQLKKQLADEVHHLELLKAEVRKIKRDVDSYRSLENEISRLLLKAHLEAAEKVYAALQKAEQVEKGAAEKVMLKRNELVNLKATMEKVKNEINSMVAQYLSVIEKAEGE